MSSLYVVGHPRYPNPEACSARLIARDRRRTTHSGGQARHECQPQSSTDRADSAVALMQGPGLEGNLAIIGGETGSGIAHFHNREGTTCDGGIDVQRENNGGPFGRDPKRVLRQVVDDLT